MAYHLGNHRLLDEMGLAPPHWRERITALEAREDGGHAGRPEGVQALLAVADTIKDSSRIAMPNCTRWASRP